MIKMTVTRIAILVILLGFVSAFVPDNDPSTRKVKTASTENGKKDKPACGPSFIVYNNSGKTITQIRLVNGTSGREYIVNNPSFPYSFPSSYSGSEYIFYIVSSTPFTTESLQVTPGLYEEIQCTNTSSGSDSYWLDFYAFACKLYTITINPSPCP